MVQARDHDLVAGLPGAGESAADGKGQGGHVVAEDDLLGPGGVEEIRHGGVGIFQYGIRGAAGLEGSAVVGVVIDQIGVHPVDDRLGDLRSAGIIEEDIRALQCGELAADRGEIEWHAGSWWVGW